MYVVFVWFWIGSIFDALRVAVNACAKFFVMIIVGSLALEIEFDVMLLRWILFCLFFFWWVVFDFDSIRMNGRGFVWYKNRGGCICSISINFDWLFLYASRRAKNRNSIEFKFWVLGFMIEFLLLLILVIYLFLGSFFWVVVVVVNGWPILCLSHRCIAQIAMKWNCKLLHHFDFVQICVNFVRNLFNLPNHFRFKFCSFSIRKLFILSAVLFFWNPIYRKKNLGVIQIANWKCAWNRPAYP